MRRVEAVDTAFSPIRSISSYGCIADEDAVDPRELCELLAEPRLAHVRAHREALNERQIARRRLKCASPELHPLSSLFRLVLL
jgi:hypothetical protein